MSNYDLTGDFTVNVSHRWKAHYVYQRGQRVKCLGYGDESVAEFADEVRNAGGSLFDTDTKTFLVERRNMR